MNRKDFEAMVWEKQKMKLSFIVAVYVSLDECFNDELIDSGVTLACGKGCSLCCNQMIVCTKPEMDEIIKFINSIKEKKIRRALKHKLENFARDWEYYRAQQPMMDSFLNNPLKFVEDWMGKACPFLAVDGSCVIYPVRIIDCRTLTSSEKCMDLETANPKKFRFDCEKWANELILEYHEDKFGCRAVIPLGQWLLLFKQSYWQPIKDEYLTITRR